MSSLEFLSPSRCLPETLASPLARALAGAGFDVVQDLSADGKVEIRGNLDLVEPGEGEELVRLTPRRGLLLVEGDPPEVVERLRAQGLRAYDVSGALAGLAIEGEQLLRRLTDLDLNALPAAGGFARIGAILVRDEGERFRVYFPQELGHYVVQVVLDTAEGLVSRGQTQGAVQPGRGEPPHPGTNGDSVGALDQSGQGQGPDPVENA
ncbi:MAG: hypothetical protein H0U82_08320 [Actinobacteria bacterium]|nr:hypothetical protein [Actinomycetota bacterium]